MPASPAQLAALADIRSKAQATLAAAVAVGGHAQDTLTRVDELEASFGAPPPPADTTPPDMQGVLQARDITTTGYTLDWLAALDAVGVVGYEVSVDGGSTWADVGLTGTWLVTGRTPGALDQAQVRAFDAAGNRAAPLQVAVQLLQPAPPPDSAMTWTKRGTTTTTSSLPPKAGPAKSQFVSLFLHGSSAMPLTIPYGSGTNTAQQDGDWWEAACTGSFADPLDGVGGYMGMAARMHNSGQGMSLLPVEHHRRPDGTLYHQHWVGRMTGLTSRLDLIGHRRVRNIIAQVKTTFAAAYPQMDPAMLWAQGQSMGAWAIGQICKDMADDVAMLFLDMPRFRYAGRVTPPVMSVVNIVGAGVSYPNVALDIPWGQGPQLSDLDGGGSAEGYFDLIAWAANPANPMPPVMAIQSTGDPYVDWTNDNPAWVAAMRSARRWFSFAWGPGGHGARPGAGTLINSHGWTAFKAGASMPLFENSSQDADPATAASGAINAGFAFRNVVDTAAGWSCEVRNVLPGVTEVDVSPYRPKQYAGPMTPQHLTLQSGVWQTVSFA